MKTPRASREGQVLTGERFKRADSDGAGVGGFSLMERQELIEIIDRLTDAFCDSIQTEEQREAYDQAVKALGEED